MSSTFSAPVSRYLSSDVLHTTAGASLEAAIALMHGRRISALPVLDGAGSIIGVLSRTDLLRAGVRHAQGGGRAVELPAQEVGELMSQGPLLVEATAPLTEAATLMVDHGVHRVFVVARGRLVGVVATVDVAAAVRDARLIVPLATLMTSPIETVEVGADLGHAAATLDRVHVTALVVVEDGWPIGTFGQIEALAGRDLPRGTAVEALYDPAVICLPAATKAHRAAAHVAQLDVRRVVVARDREPVGIVTGLDFARLVAGRVG